MDSSNSGRRPSFFWQGLMIILPVLVLAVVGLNSLHQDEQAAERAAWQRADENVHSLTRAMRVIANDELRRYESLQKEWVTGLYSAAQPSVSVMFPDGKLQAAVNQWEKSYQGLRLADLAVPVGEILSDGRETYPPEIPAVPTPPKWFSELSPGQKELWQAVRQATNTDVAESGAYNAFIAAKPSGYAVQAANYLRYSPQQILTEDRLVPTESGISFQDIASYRLLNAGEPLSPLLWDKVWYQIFETPSFMAPALLNLAEGKAGQSDHPLQEKVRLMRQLWESQSSVRRWLAPLRHFPDFHTWMDTPLAQWSRGPEDSALAVISHATFTNAGTAANGYRISFVPRPVIKAILTRALAENRFFVPDYVTVGITVDDEPVLLPGFNYAHLGVQPMATGSSWDKGDEQTLHFTTDFFLVSREQLLSVEQRRTRLFSALIAAVVLAATAGLLTARRAFYQQHRLSEMKTNFVSSVSHELRAPIASMRLLAEGLERGKISEPAKMQEYYRFLVQESRRLTSLIENVLDFSRIEQGRKEYQRESSDLDAIMEQTMKLMLPGAEARQVELVRHPSTGPGPLPSCDGLAIQQALINLIDNAIKHSAAGSKVTVGLEEASSNLVHLWVEDQGPGIPPKEHEKIFERFYRRGSELRRETQGIGIGLTIVKHIVEGHGGRVLVRSAMGQGSRFTLELPVTPK